MPRVEQDCALAGTVRGLREDRSLTREALALEAGITTGVLARVESGHASPRWATLRAIARALDLRTDQLVDQVEAVRAEEESRELIGDDARSFNRWPSEVVRRGQS